MTGVNPLKAPLVAAYPTHRRAARACGASALIRSGSCQAPRLALSPTRPRPQRLRSARPRVPGYQSGGYVRRAGTASPSMGLGASGGVDPQGGSGRGDSISIAIDARGAESGVEDKIESALDAALPVFLAKARKQEAEVAKGTSGRQRIGSGFTRRR